MDSFDPQGTRLPINIDTTTNGESLPRPLPELNRVAATLIAFNDVRAAAGARGGRFNLPKEAAFENAAADSVLAGTEFVFDIRGHHTSPIAKWRNKKSPWAEVTKFLPQAMCKPREELGAYGHMDCLSRDVFVKELFLDSDTSMAV
jgi:hypothetical protein